MDCSAGRMGADRARNPSGKDLAMRYEGTGPPSTSIGFREFLLLMAALMATQASAVDAMLPALTTIG